MTSSQSNPSDPPLLIPAINTIDWVKIYAQDNQERLNSLFSIKTSIYFVENGIMRQFRPINYFKVVTSPQYKPWNTTPVSGPSKFEDIPRVLEEFERTKYPPFLIVNISAAFNYVGQVPDMMTKSIFAKQMGVSNDSATHYHSAHQILFDIQTVSTGEFEYIRVGDFTGTAEHSSPDTYVYYFDYFLFAHKSIVRGFNSIPYDIYSTIQGVQADVSTGADDSPYMYKALGSMYVDPNSGHKDETCPAVLKVFLKYNSSGSGSAKYESKNPVWGPGSQYPFANEPTIAEMGLRLPMIVNNFAYEISSAEVRRDPVTGKQFIVPAPSISDSDTRVAQVFFQNARVHNFGDTFTMCDLLFTAKDIINNLSDCILKYDYRQFTNNALFQSVIDDNFVRYQPFVHQFMISMCNGTLPDIPGLKYPDICACVGRLGVEEALREEMGVPYVRLVCQSQRCLDGGIAQDVYTFSPTPPCFPINVCRPNLKIDAVTAYISNLTLNCDLPETNPDDFINGPPGSANGGAPPGTPAPLGTPESTQQIIIGVSVAVSLLCIIIGGIVFYIVRKKKKNALLKIN